MYHDDPNFLALNLCAVVSDNVRMFELLQDINFLLQLRLNTRILARHLLNRNVKVNITNLGSIDSTRGTKTR